MNNVIVADPASNLQWEQVNGIYFSPEDYHPWRSTAKPAKPLPTLLYQPKPDPGHRHRNYPDVSPKTWQGFINLAGKRSYCLIENEVLRGKPYLYDYAIQILHDLDLLQIKEFRRKYLRAFRANGINHAWNGEPSKETNRLHYHGIIGDCTQSIKEIKSLLRAVKITGFPKLNLKIQIRPINDPENDRSTAGQARYMTKAKFRGTTKVYFNPRTWEMKGGIPTDDYLAPKRTLLAKDVKLDICGQSRGFFVKTQEEIWDSRPWNKPDAKAKKLALDKLKTDPEIIKEAIALEAITDRHLDYIIKQLAKQKQAH